MMSIKNKKSLRELYFEISVENLPFKINSEIGTFLNRLTSEELNILEESIKTNGCRDPLVVWKEENILLDGYHRLALCQKHNKPFTTTTISFPNKTEALFWIFNNNKGRRGHGDSPYFDCESVILAFEKYFQEKAKERKREAGKAHGRGQEKVSQAVGKPIHVDRELGKLAGYSAETIRMVRFIMKNGSDQDKEWLRKRFSQTSIGRTYNGIRLVLKIRLGATKGMKKLGKLLPQEIHKDREIEEILREGEQDSYAMVWDNVRKTMYDIKNIINILTKMKDYDRLVDKNKLENIIEKSGLLSLIDELEFRIDEIKRKYAKKPSE